MNKTREEKNGTIAALFLFQYSLLIPLMRYISPSILIAFSGILLMLATLIVNKRFVVNLKSTTVIFILIMMILLKIVIDGTEFNVLLNFLMISIPPLIVFSYRFNSESFMRTCYKLSYINFLLLAFMPLIGWRVSYMRYGYGMVITVLFSYLRVFRTTEQNNDFSHGVKRVIDLVILAISALEAIVYGSRGVLVLILAFIAIDVLFIYRNHSARNFILILTGLIAVFNLENILNLLIKLTSRFGISSYAIRKYQYQLEVGLEGASSGRNILYQTAIDTIRNNPIIGVRMLTYDDGTLYAHNLFLQVGRDMGIFMMIVSVAFVVYCIYLLFTKSIPREHKTMAH